MCEPLVELYDEDSTFPEEVDSRLPRVESSLSLDLERLCRIQQNATKRSGQICEWLSFVLDINIAPDNVMAALYDGSLLCWLANLIQQAAERCGACQTQEKIPVDTLSFVDWEKTCFYVRCVRQWCLMWGVENDRLYKATDLLYIDGQELVLSTVHEMMRLASRFGVVIPDAKDLGTTPSPPSLPY